MKKLRVFTITCTICCLLMLITQWVAAEQITLPQEGLLGFRLDPLIVNGHTNLSYTDSQGSHTRDRSYAGSGAEFEMRLWLLSLEGEVEHGDVPTVLFDGKAFTTGEKAGYERVTALGKLNIKVAPRMKIVPFYGFQVVRVRYPLGRSIYSEEESFTWEGYPIGAQVKYQLTKGLQITGEYRYDPHNMVTLNYNAKHYEPFEGKATELMLRADYDFGTVGRIYASFANTSSNSDLGKESGRRINLGLTL